MISSAWKADEPFPSLASQLASVPEASQRSPTCHCLDCCAAENCDCTKDGVTNWPVMASPAFLPSKLSET